MKKIFLLFLFVLISVISYSQRDSANYVTQDQKIRFKSNIWTTDSVIMEGLYGTGTVIRIDENGYLYRSTGTSIDTIPIGQVLGLQDSLAKFQEILIVDSNFVLSGANLNLNDTIWTEVGRFSDEVRIKNNTPRILIRDANVPVNNKNIQLTLVDGELVFQYLNDNEISGGGDYMALERVDNNMTSLNIFDNAVSKITLKNSGTGVFEDTVRSGQLKVAGILYPLTDGSANQVITTNGSGVLSFSEAASLLTAGDNITISNDTISATAATDSDWTASGGDVYNNTDNIGIGLVSPARKLDVSGQSRFSSSQNPTVEIIQNSTPFVPALTITSASSTGIEITSDAVFGDGIKLNGYGVDSISNDTVLRDNSISQSTLITEYAVKRNEEFNRKNNTRISWAADVDTSARVNGFVIKWNDATKTHYYDTAGTGGGGSTYFAGAGLELSGTTFSIGTDSVTYDMIQNVSGNSVLARAASGAGNVSEVSLAASELLGRGSTGNVAAITVGSGLSMSGTTLTATATGDITAVVAGDGLTGGAMSGSATLDIGAGDGIDVATNSIAVDPTDIIGDGLVEVSSNITLGTPSSINTNTTNTVTTNSHTHTISYAPSDAFTYYTDTSLASAGTVTSGQGIDMDSTNNRVVCKITNESGDTLTLADGYYMVSIKATIKVDTEARWGAKSNFYTVKLYKGAGNFDIGQKVTGLTEVTTANAKQNSYARIASVTSAGEGSPATITYPDGEAYMTISTHPVKVLISAEAGRRLYATIISSKDITNDYVEHLGATMQVTRVREYESGNEQQNQ